MYGELWLPQSEIFHLDKNSIMYSVQNILWNLKDKINLHVLRNLPCNVAILWKPGVDFPYDSLCFHLYSNLLWFVDDSSMCIFAAFRFNIYYSNLIQIPHWSLGTIQRYDGILVCSFRLLTSQAGFKRIWARRR